MTDHIDSSKWTGLGQTVETKLSPEAELKQGKDNLKLGALFLVIGVILIAIPAPHFSTSLGSGFAFMSLVDLFLGYRQRKKAFRDIANAS